MDNIQRIRAFLLIFIVSVLLLAIYFIQEKRERKGSITVNKIQSGISHFHLIEQTPSKVNWELWAENASISSGEKLSVLIKPKIKVFLDTVSTPIEIQSQKGNLNSITKQITLSDNVIATTGLLKITTDTILWKSEGSFLETKSKVKITGTDFEVEGKGLKAFVKEEKVELLNNVRGKIYLKNLPGTKSFQK